MKDIKHYLQGETRNIRDFIHLYLGCECMLPDNDGDYVPAGTITASIIGGTYYGPDQCKPILRPLLDMTDEERIYLAGVTAFSLGKPADHYRVSSDNEWSHPQVECGAYYGRVVFHPSPFTICYYNKDNEPREYSTPEIFRWLLSKGFDLFGLIDAGLAIDKTKLSNQ